MDQRQINDAEWQDPKNWHGGWLGVYHSQQDSRLWVPKRNPIMGWTVNTARPAGLALVIAPFLVALVVVVVALGARK